MLKLKKSLGQHFLKDGVIIEKIVSALREETFSRLLEVGPGGGALTTHLLQLPDIEFKAVELDEEKIDYLTHKHPKLSGNLLHKSFLDIEQPFTDSFIVIGNFPYNISTQILFKILDWKDDVPVVIGMFQKEVALRAAADPGSKAFGVLSALIQPFYEIDYLFDVPPESFTPPPKVNSGVIRLRRKNQKLGYKNEKAYRALVKTAFNQRRKTLRNATRSLFSPEILKDPIFDKRAEMLSIQDFAELTFKMTGFMDDIN